MSRVDRRRYLITYDISDDKRREKIFHELHGFGDWAQFSVFFCELTERELVRLRSAIRDVVHQVEDQVMILDLGKARRPLEHSLDIVGRGYEPMIRSQIF